MSVTIRQANIDEIPGVIAVMKAFENESEFVTVEVEYSAAKYINLVNIGIGALFVLYKEGQIIGGMGCIKAPDLHDGKLTAIETFWLVLPEYRGHGMKLFKAFEKWSDDQGCQKNAMIHLADSFPSQLDKLYQREGYRLAELHFVKEKKI